MLVHWSWVFIGVSFGACVGYVAAMLFRHIRPGGEYYPSIEDAEHLYRPRSNVTNLKPRIWK